jgi:predicted membrane chloride channel (bestrophin family)
MQIALMRLGRRTACASLNIDTSMHCIQEPSSLITMTALQGINEIGIDIEEPFSMLPLEAIADRASQDCRELIEMQVFG